MRKIKGKYLFSQVTLVLFSSLLSIVCGITVMCNEPNGSKSSVDYLSNYSCERAYNDWLIATGVNPIDIEKIKKVVAMMEKLSCINDNLFWNELLLAYESLSPKKQDIIMTNLFDLRKCSFLNIFMNSLDFFSPEMRDKFLKRYIVDQKNNYLNECDWSLALSVYPQDGSADVIWDIFLGENDEKKSAIILEHYLVAKFKLKKKINEHDFKVILDKEKNNNFNRIYSLKGLCKILESKSSKSQLKEVIKKRHLEAKEKLEDLARLAYKKIQQ